MNEIVDRVKRILLNPNEALEEVKGEEINVQDFMKQYVAVVAAIPAVAMFIGFLGLRANFMRSLLFCVLFYVVNLIAVFVFGKIIDALAPTFNATKDDLNAFKLSVYAFTPYFVAGIANINPGLGFLSILGGLYGIYVLYLGTTSLMSAPQEKTVPYTAVALIINAVVFVVLYMIAVAVTGMSPTRLLG